LIPTLNPVGHQSEEVGVDSVEGEGEEEGEEY
jgi:hypothetical protein